MKDLIKLYKLLVSKLPEAIKTKINKSDLDRGGYGVFTARRKRSDKVIIPFKSLLRTVISGILNIIDLK